MTFIIGGILQGHDRLERCSPPTPIGRAADVPTPRGVREFLDASPSRRVDHLLPAQRFGTLSRFANSVQFFHDLRDDLRFR